MDMRIIGLTGNIACGKSTVSNMLRELGAYIIDADVVARKVMRSGEPAWEAVYEQFGDEYIREDGEIDRAKLGELVFESSHALEKLNGIVHPIIVKTIEDELNCLIREGKHKVIVIDAALLIETGCQRLVDEVWLVTLPYEVQLKRLMKRDNLTKREAKQRIESQMPQYEKKEHAHVIIDNSMAIEYTREQVEHMWNELKH